MPELQGMIQLNLERSKTMPEGLQKECKAQDCKDSRHQWGHSQMPWLSRLGLSAAPASQKLEGHGKPSCPSLPTSMSCACIKACLTSLT